MLKGLGNFASSSHKDIYKAVKTAVTDRSMPVRCAATKVNNHLSMCLSSLVLEKTVS